MRNRAGRGGGREKKREAGAGIREKDVERKGEREPRVRGGKRHFTVQTFQSCDAGITDTLFEIKARAPGQRVEHNVDLYARTYTPVRQRKRER